MAMLISLQGKQRKQYIWAKKSSIDETTMNGIRLKYIYAKNIC